MLTRGFLARVRRGLFRAALGVSMLVAGVGVVAAVAVPTWWNLHDQTMVTITSGSMRPLIEPTDRLLIQRVEAGQEFAVGEVVTVRRGNGTLVTHRIVEVTEVPGREGKWLRLRGDANPTPDADLDSASSVVGVVVSRLGWVGPVIAGAQEPGWRAALFGPALLMAALAEMPALLGRRRPDGTSEVAASSDPAPLP